MNHKYHRTYEIVAKRYMLWFARGRTVMLAEIMWYGMTILPGSRKEVKIANVADFVQRSTCPAYSMDDSSIVQEMND
jgi:hypothetical protein